MLVRILQPCRIGQVKIKLARDEENLEDILAIGSYVGRFCDTFRTSVEPGGSTL